MTFGIDHFSQRLISIRQQLFCKIFFLDYFVQLFPFQSSSFVMHPLPVSSNPNKSYIFGVQFWCQKTVDYRNIHTVFVCVNAIFDELECNSRSSRVFVIRTKATFRRSTFHDSSKNTPWLAMRRPRIWIDHCRNFVASKHMMCRRWLHSTPHFQKFEIVEQFRQRICEVKKS